MRPLMIVSLLACLFLLACVPCASVQAACDSGACGVQPVRRIVNRTETVTRQTSRKALESTHKLTRRICRAGGCG